MPDPAPPLSRVLETALYVADMARARDFYERILGLAPAFADERLTAYPIGGTVLLLFLKGGTTETVHMPGGTIPPHDGDGQLHYALAIAATDLPAWEARLAAHRKAYGRRAKRAGRLAQLHDCNHPVPSEKHPPVRISQHLRGQRLPDAYPHP